VLVLSEAVLVIASSQAKHPAIAAYEHEHEREP
jgi:hypothetical protein